MRKLTREPTAPGKILQEEFLGPLRLTQKKLADHLSCDSKVIHRIVKGRSAVTADVAVLLAAALGTTPEFWLNAQRAVDLYRASAKMRPLPGAIPKGGRPA